jgi:hypothetical protein
MGVVFKPTKSMLNALAEEIELLTFRVTLMECVIEPLVPVMVSVELDTGVPVVVVTVRVEFPEPVTEVGAKVLVAPAGVPEIPRLTVLAKPFRAPIVTV